MFVAKTIAAAPMLSSRWAAGIPEHRAGSPPIARALQGRDVGEIDAVHEQSRRMEAAESLRNPAVDETVVLGRRLPAHAAKDPECAHD